MELFLAISLGLLFGFALNRVGATNPQNIINMLRLNDLKLMKIILLAIGLSSIALFSCLMFGLIDPSHISIKSSYIGVIVGGGLLGIGFTIAGYCPGTGLAALASGRKDAFFFILGGLLGAFIFTLSFEWIGNNTNMFETLFGGKTSLAATGNEKYEGLLNFADGHMIGIIFGVVTMVIAIILPKSICGTCCKGK